MTKRRRPIKISLAAITILLSFASMNININFSANGAYGKVDLFTQKVPFNGRGLNVPSDAFGPGEIVILYAMVQYNEQPLQNHLVTFHIQSPNGSSFSLTSTTNATGIASTSFRLPYSNETFGEWRTTAIARIGDQNFQDALTFKVDWIIKLISVRTIDNNLTTRNYFGKNGDVGLEIILRNIAMIEKNVTLAIVLLDDLKVPIDFIEINNFEAQPNGKVLYLYCKMTIPKWAFVGKGKVFVSALTAPPSQNGVAYCPSISTKFFITISQPIKVEFHDVAVVKVYPSASSILIGEQVHINVKVRNEGTTFESFDISVYLNDKIVGELKILNLAPYASKVLSFALNTSGMKPGNYLLSAAIPKILDEADTTDNIIVDGYIEIRPTKMRFQVTFEQTELSADAYGIVLTVNGSAITINDLPYSFWVEEGSIVTYSYEETVMSTISGKRFKLKSVTGPASPIIVTNNMVVVGNYKTQHLLTVNTNPEGLSPQPARNPTGEACSTNSWWYDKDTNVSLIALPIKGYTFEYWDVDKIAKYHNIYEIVVFMDHPHTATAHYTGKVEWLYLILLAIIILLIILLIVLAYHRIKEKRRKEEAFYRGWAAWYYGYNLRGKHKFNTC
jgi:hypothetical protein